MVQEAKCLGSLRTEPFCVFAQKALRQTTGEAKEPYQGNPGRRFLLNAFAKHCLVLDKPCAVGKGL